MGWATRPGGGGHTGVKAESPALAKKLGWATLKIFYNSNIMIGSTKYRKQKNHPRKQNFTVLEKTKLLTMVFSWLTNEERNHS